MKLKTRKMILILSVSAMGIGLIAFAAANTTGNSEANSTEVASVEDGTDAVGTTSEEADTLTAEADEETTEEATETTTPTEEATTDDNPIEMNAYPEINELITDYLEANVSCDEKALKKLVTDKSAIDIERIQQRTEYIESYDNIEVYTKKGNGDIDFVAYVYLDMKIASIDTEGPGLNSYYIREVDGEYKIVNEELSEETQAYVDELNNEQDVLDLIDSLMAKVNDAINSDDTLKEFYSKIVDNVDNSATEESSDETTESDETEDSSTK